MATVKVNVTDAAIKRHAAQADVTQLRDQTHGNLYFRYHTSRATGSWYLVTHTGGKRWRRIGRWPEVAATVIRREVPKALADATNDIQTDMDLAGVLAWYRDRTLVNREVTRDWGRDVRGIIDNHLMPAAEQMQKPLDQINRRDLDSGLFLPLQSILKPSTLQKVFRVLKAATKRAAALDIIGHDPLSAYRFTDFVKTKIPNKASALRGDAAAQLLDRVNNAAHGHRMLALLILLHATRITETRLAVWPDFDLVGGWWHIPAAHTKNRKAHRLPLTQVAIEALTDYQPHTDGYHLFAGNGEAISRAQAANWIRAISEGKWASHDLRKLARTVWADLGIDYMVSELLLNHTLSKLDRTYIHTYADEQAREALEKYHQWLSEKGAFKGRQGVDGLINRNGYEPRSAQAQTLKQDRS